MWRDFFRDGDGYSRVIGDRVNEPLQIFGESFLPRSNLMSDVPRADAGSFDAEIADQFVQRQSDRFAMPDLSGDGEVRSSVLRHPSRRSTNPTLEVRVYDSFPAYSSTTALGDAFAKANSTGLTVKVVDVADE
jgi:hypothetical protein